MGKYTYSAIGILFFVVPVLLFGLAALIGRYKNLDYSLIAWRKLSVGQRLFSISMALMLTAFTIIFVYQTISTFGPKSLMILIPMGLGIGWFLKAAVNVPYIKEKTERGPRSQRDVREPDGIRISRLERNGKGLLDQRPLGILTRRWSGS